MITTEKFKTQITYEVIIRYWQILFNSQTSITFGQKWPFVDKNVKPIPIKLSGSTSEIYKNCITMT